jgi:hypothetical protein
MKRYTIIKLRGIDEFVVLDNTTDSYNRDYYSRAIQLGKLEDVLTNVTNQEWLAQLQGTDSIVCELDNYLDLPKLHPELLI